ncbi:hypothetical protein AO287_21255 [Pseudomonas savastanoi]|uniref:Uncharacterized protein n=1 Tax=Pseudomonas savastanoi TaxID=29438 RepID=A0AAW3LUU3_PSESS|nr:hypothetical protein AO287_21255 [Pseudomonas savastanoi]
MPLTKRISWIAAFGKAVGLISSRGLRDGFQIFEHHDVLEVKGITLRVLQSKPSHPVFAAADQLDGRLKDLIAQGHSQAEVSSKLGTSHQTVSNNLEK